MRSVEERRIIARDSIIKTLPRHSYLREMIENKTTHFGITSFELDGSQAKIEVVKLESGEIIVFDVQHVKDTKRDLLVPILKWKKGAITEEETHGAD